MSELDDLGQEIQGGNCSRALCEDFSAEALRECQRIALSKWGYIEKFGHDARELLYLAIIRTYVVLLWGPNRVPQKVFVQRIFQCYAWHHGQDGTWIEVYPWVTEMFVKKKVVPFRFAHENAVRGFVLRTVWNLLRNGEDYGDLPPYLPDDGPPERTVEQVLQDAVRDAVREEKGRRSVAYLHTCGYSNKEIEAELGKTETAVTTALNRFRRDGAIVFARQGPAIIFQVFKALPWDSLLEGSPPWDEPKDWPVLGDGCIQATRWCFMVASLPEFSDYYQEDCKLQMGEALSAIVALHKTSVNNLRDALASEFCSPLACEVAGLGTRCYEMEATAQACDFVAFLHASALARPRIERLEDLEWRERHEEAMVTQLREWRIQHVEEAFGDGWLRLADAMLTSATGRLPKELATDDFFWHRALWCALYGRTAI